MPRTPSKRKIDRKARKGLYYNPENNSFETMQEQSRRLYNKDIPTNPDVIVNEGKPNQRSMSNKEYMNEFGVSKYTEKALDEHMDQLSNNNKRRTKRRK